MSETKVTTPLVVNLADAPEHDALDGAHWGHHYRVLTPGMREAGGKLGVCCNRLPPGRAAVPFHTHRLEDEVFYVLSGRGLLRYGDHLVPLKAGDCISCPAGSGVAHQIANPADTADGDLVYLGIGNHEPNEICEYPDTGKVYVRGVAVGRLTRTPYMDGEPDVPVVLGLAQGADGE